MSVTRWDRPSGGVFANINRVVRNSAPSDDMSEFIAIGSAAEIPDPGKKWIAVDDRIVVVFHVGGRFYCIDDVCTHDGGPLSEGSLVDHMIACPRHGAKFDIRTGHAVTMPATEATAAHEIKVENGQLFVRLS